MRMLWLSRFSDETSTPSAEHREISATIWLVGLVGTVDGELGVLAVEGLALGVEERMV